MTKISYILWFVALGTQMLLSAQDQRVLPCEELAPFYHGVASGDPLADRVLLWTRLTPDEPGNSFEVHWRIGLDTGMTQLHSMGSAFALAANDFTVKVDVSGLLPDQWYYYDFRYNEQYSLRGRTRTLPAEGTDDFRMAVASCSNYEFGYFNAYRIMANRSDIDLVLHLGDYIYEYQTGGYSANLDDRITSPEQETITLDDYRLRYSHYRLDPDLREAHRQLPWITVWDDHESANNAWKEGAQNHNAGEGDWNDRKSASIKAYYEWLPVREVEEGLVRRKFRIGDLIDLFMLDTRLEGRDEQVEFGSPEADNPARSLLGDAQKAWLSEQLSDPPALWTVFGQQVMMAPLEAFGNGVNTDQWDGYRPDRDWLYNQWQTNGRTNIVVLTGDIHSSWANDLPLDEYNDAANTGSIGVEFVVSSVTSPTLPINISEGFIQVLNPHVQFVDLQEHGFVLVDFNEERVQGDWVYVNNLEISNAGYEIGASYRCGEGQTWMEAAPVPLSAVNNGVLPAPDCPFEGISSVEESLPVLLSAYPNPFFDRLVIQFALFRQDNVSVKMYDLSGRILLQENIGELGTGVHYLELKGLSPESGMYFLEVSGRSGSSAVWKMQRQ